MEGIQRLFKIGVYNLLIVATIGFIMRYKILFDLPLLVQKNLLHAHSHFAFAAWVSHFLYCALTLIIIPYIDTSRIKKYHNLIVLNLICAFGMLIAFTIQGYKFVSITFSTLTIVVSFLYALNFFKDAKQMPNNVSFKPWAKAAVFLNLISCLGPFSLAYIMATHHTNTNFYLSSVYYYLHFQYNGWFLFGTMAITLAYIPINYERSRKIFFLFIATVFPTYLLSVLWFKFPFAIYIIVVISANIQLIAWILWLIEIKKSNDNHPIITRHKWILTFFYGSILAASIKFILQLMSAIPSLNKFVFGIRPIVIAYLHLVLLGVFSLFIFGYLFSSKNLRINKLSKIGALLFFSGVVFNEFLLGIQGVASFRYFHLPFMNELLLLAAVIFILSLIIIIISQTKKFQPVRRI